MTGYDRKNSVQLMDADRVFWYYGFFRISFNGP